MQGIQIIFWIVVMSFFVPLIGAFIAAIIYKYKIHRAHLLIKIVFIAFDIALTFGILFALRGLNKLGEYLIGFPLGTYICVLTYTILLAIMSSESICNMFFLDRKQGVNSMFSAFKVGYTRAASHMLVFYMPIKPIIYSFYLLCLIVSQVVSLGYTFLSNEIVVFCQMNEYGIVILIAIQEMINSWKKKTDKKRIDIVQDVLDKDIMGYKGKE